MPPPHFTILLPSNHFYTPDLIGISGRLTGTRFAHLCAFCAKHSRKNLDAAGALLSGDGETSPTFSDFFHSIFQFSRRTDEVSEDEYAVETSTGIG
jgi:hypothetical protein